MGWYPDDPMLLAGDLAQLESAKVRPCAGPTCSVRAVSARHDPTRGESGWAWDVRRRWRSG